MTYRYFYNEQGDIQKVFTIRRSGEPLNLRVTRISLDPPLYVDSDQEPNTVASINPETRELVLV